MYPTVIFKTVTAIMFLAVNVCANPLSRMIRSTSTNQNDAPFSTCSNRSSLANPQLYYPATTLVPVHGFDTGLLPHGKYTTEDAIQDSECPYDQPPSDHRLSESGLCPFDFYEDYDSDRIPATILKARCRPSCNTCIDPYNNQKTAALRCKEVMFSIKVLKKESCEGDVFKYRQYEEEFPVACVCQRTVRPQPGPGTGDLPPPPL